MKRLEERTQDTIERAKLTRTNAKRKFTRKCRAFAELSEQAGPVLVLQEKFHDIRENFTELDKANDQLITMINETAPHHLMDGMLEECDDYMKEVESTLDKVRAIYASRVSEDASKQTRINVKALDAPRFSGNIRDYSNFKQDFTRLMVSSYGKEKGCLCSTFMPNWFGPQRYKRS